MIKKKKGGGLLRPVIPLLLLMKPHSHFLVTETSVFILHNDTIRCRVNETTYEVFLTQHWISTPFEIRPGLLCCSFTNFGRYAGQWLIDNGIKNEVQYTQLELDLVEYVPTEEEKEAEEHG